MRDVLHGLAAVDDEGVADCETRVGKRGDDDAGAEALTRSEFPSLGQLVCVQRVDHLVRPEHGEYQQFTCRPASSRALRLARPSTRRVDGRTATR